MVKHFQIRLESDLATGLHPKLNDPIILNEDIHIIFRYEGHR